MEPEENGFYGVQFEGFPGKSRRADWVLQEARELIARSQAYRGILENQGWGYPVEGILQC